MTTITIKLDASDKEAHTHLETSNLSTASQREQDMVKYVCECVKIALTVYADKTGGDATIRENFNAVDQN